MPSETTHARGERVSASTQVRSAMAVLIVAVVWLVGCGGTEPAERSPNVLLITLDTTRFDALGSYGGQLAAETPHLDRLAEQGVRFKQAYSQVPSTLPSHASILTGLTPLSHGVHDNAVYRLAPEVETVSETLADAGYATSAFVSAFVLDRRFGLDQGFGTYDDEMEEPLRIGELPPLPPNADPQMLGLVTRFYEPYQRRADRVTPRAIEWLDRQSGDEPFMLWVHYFDPHEPYTPPTRWVERYDPDYDGAMTGQVGDFYAAAGEGRATDADLRNMLARYRGEVSFVDEWIGELFGALDSRGLLEQTLIVVVADHGESLGEHGMYFVHNLGLYQETVRVPLLIRFPGGKFSGLQVEQAVRTVDIVPTLRDYLGLGEADLDGRSLIPLLDGSNPDPIDAYFQTLCEKQVVPVPIERRGLLADGWKLLRTTERAAGRRQLELYDLSRDPGEERNLAEAESARAAELDQRVDQIIRTSTPRAEAEIEELDEETLEKLRSLGYAR